MFPETFCCSVLAPGGLLVECEGRPPEPPLSSGDKQPDLQATLASIHWLKMGKINEFVIRKVNTAKQWGTASEMLMLFAFLFCRPLLCLECSPFSRQRAFELVFMSPPAFWTPGRPEGIPDTYSGICFQSLPLHSSVDAKTRRWHRENVLARLKVFGPPHQRDSDVMGIQRAPAGLMMWRWSCSDTLQKGFLCCVLEYVSLCVFLNVSVTCQAALFHLFCCVSFPDDNSTPLYLPSMKRNALPFTMTYRKTQSMFSIQHVMANFPWGVRFVIVGRVGGCCCGGYVRMLNHLG